MMDLQGSVNFARVFGAYSAHDINALYNGILADPCLGPQAKIRIMPDYHDGVGCVIGTTIADFEGIRASYIGTDIGCGVTWAVIEDTGGIDFAGIHAWLTQNCVRGKHGRSTIHPLFDMHQFGPEIMNVLEHIDERDKAQYVFQSLGTLGGGNHFIEMNRLDITHVLLAVHSGSRQFGQLICNRYSVQNDGVNGEGVLTGELLQDYLYAADVAQRYAEMNRWLLIDDIISTFGLTAVELNSTIHNYIDVKNRIARKGAISAMIGERVLIPLNMVDGSLLCVGKGNPDWNYSGPHGAGRLLSRSSAKSVLDLDEEQRAMKKLVAHSLTSSNLDEARGAYKPMADTIAYIHDAVDIIAICPPIINFKG